MRHIENPRAVERKKGKALVRSILNKIGGDTPLTQDEKRAFMRVVFGKDN